MRRMLLTLLLACSPPPLDTGGPVDTTPAIRISWPPPESEVIGCETIAVDVENFKLVDFSSASLEGELPTSEGHYHVYHPGGYDSCFKPFCPVDFSEVLATTEPYFVAVLVQHDHTELRDDDGDRIEFTLPFTFTAGDCATSGGGDGGDSGVR